MTRIGLLSDTHGYLHPRIAAFFGECHEIWHAGDVGNAEVLRKLKEIAPVRAVYGNIDGSAVRTDHGEYCHFQTENIWVLMTHIGGYPGKYTPKARAEIETRKPGIFVAGHSHILKVMYDKKYGHLYINPGAAGKEGFHRKITAVRFIIDGSDIRDMEILELER